MIAVTKKFISLGLLALSLSDLDDAHTALENRMNVALMSDIGHFQSSVEVLKARATFPLEVKITPCSYLSAIDLKLRMGIDASVNNPLEYNHVAYSERLTLQKI